MFRFEFEQTVSVYKRGKWNAEEDRKLKAYINKHGVWIWNEMAKAAGLSRSGKSCRLRWLNYLKPGRKLGSFSEEEEKTIHELHNKLGNCWSAIAAELPGRTDNDVKNYWNTRSRKRIKLEDHHHHPISQGSSSSSLLKEEKETPEVLVRSTGPPVASGDFKEIILVDKPLLPNINSPSPAVSTSTHTSLTAAEMVNRNYLALEDNLDINGQVLRFQFGDINYDQFWMEDRQNNGCSQDLFLQDTIFEGCNIDNRDLFWFDRFDS